VNTAGGVALKKKREMEQWLLSQVPSYDARQHFMQVGLQLLFVMSYFV
jgi:hypothetical protein